MSTTWLVVGLGNPGPDYAGHRHNVGQMAVSQLASDIGATFKSHKANALVAEGWVRPGGPKLVIAKPNTFMNLSGGPVANLLKFYGVEPANLIVLHDELDIDFDVIRLKSNGGHGGHNGLRDIIAAIGTNEFNRVRIGIGRPPGRQDAADFVLSNFNSSEREILPHVLAHATDAVETIADEGILAAQQRFNSPA
ncbi:PTH1 family peptidyl-tRNA hydrolase [Aurantimicrobium minutum]|uniref:aminoacyl-tRNA hydrolase n=1 Tax=Aurantimicrobium minutum TaxID=708131 RepID=UPI00247463CB|nr:aminoacyl-tRNA hydrolase [Aurantimicrobium minutum]MDH6255850.1 PTH1 family peptidyl-tRNA hydrolase [Aurantimicrobium minutum]MDH6424239.1 PTH1 family peptidyl-tRNA hydrolase [Aurantimicrobium minutum]